MVNMTQNLMKTLTYDSKRLRRRTFVRAIFVSMFNLAFSIMLTRIMGVENLEPYIGYLVVIGCYTALLYLSVRVCKAIFRKDTALMQTYIQYGKGNIRYVKKYYEGNRYKCDIHELTNISYVSVNKKEIEIMGDMFKVKDAHGSKQNTEQSKAVLIIKNTFKNANELAEGWNR